MKMQAPVILIIGAGPNIGAAIANKFSENGYKVALAAQQVYNQMGLST
jgi:NAD(P)-dependent dehydrogenase (short-subunit alcohol dehydrogenase family)